MNPAFLRTNEEMIRRIVREEMHVREELGKMSHYNLPPPRLLPDLKTLNIQAPYRLRFINKVNNPTFTTKLVRDNNGDPIRIEIYDSYTRSKVSPDCFLSSAKVRITVLDADFWNYKGVNWSRSEFNQSVLRERDGKGPILISPSLTIRLENGVGTFGNIIFNDNSSWTKSGFRLGVMVDVEGEEGYLNGERVQEGVSEPFRVKDRRVKASQKPDLLKLTHSIQCIKKIGKDRASLLQKKNINTVEDFLKLYYNDEAALREILCIKSESDKGWMSMVEHATQRADEFHAKCNALNNSSQPRQVIDEIQAREELGIMTHYNNLPPSRLLPDLNIQARYQLQFINKVQDPTYTTDLVRDEIGVPIRVEIYDSYTRSRVSPDCFLSSAKVIIIVLDADFWKNRVNWSRSEFVQNMLRGREGKDPILIGRSRTIQLENGVGTFGNIIFNDNSSWMKWGFRLGVMVEGDGEEGYLNGERVQEGVSEPFQVRDRRTEGDIPARYGQLPPICDSSSMNVLNEHISTAAASASASALFPETNRTNVERGNILNGNSVQHTNVGNVESSPNYNTQVPSGGGGYSYGHGRFRRSFPRRDTAAWWDRPRGPPPPSCRARLIMVAIYYNSG